MLPFYAQLLHYEVVNPVIKTIIIFDLDCSFEYPYAFSSSMSTQRQSITNIMHMHVLISRNFEYYQWEIRARTCRIQIDGLMLFSA